MKVASKPPAIAYAYVFAIGAKVAFHSTQSEQWNESNNNNCSGKQNGPVHFDRAMEQRKHLTTETAAVGLIEHRRLKRQFVMGGESAKHALDHDYSRIDNEAEVNGAH